ncbi:MAG TPA: phosphoribosylaminoimidazolesuccinocarboxamide synthase [Mycobacteriales bacterium]|nr:phosphoribosylaminoimidazolesuccinocarboxamide synthase [Mycobacteriales bacterium]
MALTHLHSGKVRDLYATDSGELLLVASDRISAFDFVLPTPIPDKGRILTLLSVWWFDQLADLVPTHLLSATEVPEEYAGRALLCRPLQMLPVECVARGYLTGSGLADYGATGAVCGVRLPPGLVDGSRLPETIFTPATKAPVGEHDENVSYAAMAQTVGAAVAEELRRLTLAIYERAAGIALDRGIILADTKFEFGLDPQGMITLADEVLTPDSSRFWDAGRWEPGHGQSSYDKQYVRDWLAKDSGWDRESPPPELPDAVVAATRERYVEAYERLTGRRYPAG